MVPGSSMILSMTALSITGLRPRPARTLPTDLTPSNEKMRSPDSLFRSSSSLSSLGTLRPILVQPVLAATLAATRPDMSRRRPTIRSIAPGNGHIPTSIDTLSVPLDQSASWGPSGGHPAADRESPCSRGWEPEVSSSHTAWSFVPSPPSDTQSLRLAPGSPTSERVTFSRGAPAIFTSRWSGKTDTCSTSSSMRTRRSTSLAASQTRLTSRSRSAAATCSNRAASSSSCRSSCRRPEASARTASISRVSLCSSSANSSAEIRSA